MPTAVKSWKFLILKDGKITSHYNGYTPNTRDRCVWEVGEWKHVDGWIQPCHFGFHHSDNPYDALSYVAGDVLARVEVKGMRVRDDDDTEPYHKEAVSDMRIVKAGLWSKTDSVSVALHAATLAAAKSPGAYRERVLLDRGVAAVRQWLHNGQPADVSLLTDLNSASYGYRSGTYSGTSYDLYGQAASAVYYAVAATRPDTSPEYAAGHATYAVGNTQRMTEGVIGRHGFVKGSVNEWMENRFKTLPKF